MEIDVAGMREDVKHARAQELSESQNLMHHGWPGADAMRTRWRFYVELHWQAFGPGHCALCRRVGITGTPGA